MKEIVHHVLTVLAGALDHALRQRTQDRDGLVEVGRRVGHPYVPGEDLCAYRRRIVALRDEDPRRFAGEEAAR